MCSFDFNHLIWIMDHGLQLLLKCLILVHLICPVCQSPILIQYSRLPISTLCLVPQGEDTRRHMSAELYLECSAKYRENVEDIFREATKKALASSRRAKHRTRKRHCVVLWPLSERTEAWSQLTQQDTLSPGLTCKIYTICCLSIINNCLPHPGSS